MKMLRNFTLSIALFAISISLNAQLAGGKQAVGNSSSANYTKPVNHEIASFDDLPLEPESAWYGSTTGQANNTFYSGSYSFTNSYDETWYSWGGFAYTNITETNYDPAQWFEHQFLSVVGSGANGSDNFAVVYPSDYNLTDIEVMHNDDGDIIAGAYVTNSAYTQYSILNGDAYMGELFAQGDYYKVMFIKDDGKSAADTVEYYLADYRSTNAAEHYSLTEWQWVDLSPLGQVKKIRIAVDASRKDQWGLTLPTYLCMDELGSPRPIYTEYAWNIYAQQENTLNLRDILSFETGIAISYRIIESNNSLYTAVIEGDDLKVTQNQALTNEDVLIEATQKGLSKFIIIKMTSLTGIDDVNAKQVSIYPNPAKDVLHINGTASTFEIRIIDLRGKTVMQQKCAAGDAIMLNNLPSGVYFVEVLEGGKQTVRKLVIND